ncbi:MAG: hypothetical protein WD069_18780 [Planctomycetales bacterium]
MIRNNNNNVRSQSRRARAKSRRAIQRHAARRARNGSTALGHRETRPAAAHRQRGHSRRDRSEAFNAPEVWHPATGGEIRFVVQPAGAGYVHPVTVEEARARIAELPAEFRAGIEVVQLSRMTRKRALFPCYGMQWGPNIYLYPIEESLQELYVHPPLPSQRIEAQMYGGRWTQEDGYWKLAWTRAAIRDFYLNNVLIHEIGHVHDRRNSSSVDRERFAEWFAIEHGYRATRSRREDAKTRRLAKTTG